MLKNDSLQWPDERLACIFCGSAGLVEVIVFPEFPAFMGCVTAPRSKDVLAQMAWDACELCGMIQLRQPLPLELVYLAPHGSGRVGHLWNLHHEQFAEFLLQDDPPSVLEIGGGHGLLANKYLEQSQVEWTIVEPNPGGSINPSVTILKQFFDEHTDVEGPQEVVVHSHVLEHAYEPKRFLQVIAKSMAPNGKLLFSVPNMDAMLERGYVNMLNFEHTYLLTRDFVEGFLSQAGFTVTRRQWFREDHSVFWATELADGPAALERKSESSVPAKELSKVFSRIRDWTDELNSLLKESETPTFLFGAHIFSQYLLALGLNEAAITAVLDNDPDKHHQRLYGTTLEVIPPSSLSMLAEANVILLTGVYSQEIREGLNLLPGVSINFLALDDLG